jgi:hypothetical protein
MGESKGCCSDDCERKERCKNFETPGKMYQNRLAK